MTRLSARAPAPLGYAPEDHGVGIVHLGLGNFARAHILAYTDEALAAAGGDWRVTGVSLRGTAVADTLAPQDGRYTLLTRGAETTGRVIGALADVIAGPDAGARALAAMAAPGCRIVSITVTEKGYGITSDGALNRDHPAVAADLAHPDAPRGVIGLIVAALRQRRAEGSGPFTVLSCDNLSHNGAKLRAAVLDFAAPDADLAGWIAERVTFPSTMVDRITPASTPDTIAAARDLTGFDDAAAVETEPFRQWVIEDDFCAGRPAWDRTDVLFVPDVAPYEQMKLRMLNGAHSMMAYSGQLSGKTFTRDVMADPAHAALVRRHLAAAAATVRGLDIDLDAYAAALMDRFANPAIAHATAQIAMDGTQKMPPRITAPALEALAEGRGLRPFTFALAAWLAYVMRAAQVDDPMAARMAELRRRATTAAEVIAGMAALCPDILPPALTTGPAGRDLCDILDLILRDGMAAAMAREA
ncbi:mannitol dehydrogenase family protein [Falsirhodobacter halotolerans]|uniref:mannitol dehydrogenase family protein n=1 Tax=Falsirhodobacter halotolerans TaxID=1146892 RepID=UPI001FD01EA2|nr:mannitol dehydrogenase family protein [Falsirhodobacter halotolerans]MCJ8140924.1 mannitol dehydrogenase family protein [Falsirhodobacter halotolerans]